MSNVIVIGDSEQVATYIEQHLQILSLLQEIQKVNADNQAKLAKLNSDVATLAQNYGAATTENTTLKQQNTDLANQVATLTAAAATSDQETGAALDSVDQAVNAALSPTPAPAEPAQ